MRLRTYIQAGVNTIALHDELLRQDWLGYADELGVQVVVVPRCVGRCNRRNGGSEDQVQSFMSLQDQRLLWDSHIHPSVTMFVLEGDTNRRRNDHSLWTEQLRGSLHNIPVFGLDLPSRLLQVQHGPVGSTSTCQGQGCQGGWLVETVMKGGFVPCEPLSMAYAAEVCAGALGGVIPTPRQAEREQWVQAWQRAMQDIALTPLDNAERRSMSVVAVQGLAGQVITLSAPGMNRTGTRLDSAGEEEVQVGCHRRPPAVALGGLPAAAGHQPS